MARQVLRFQLTGPAASFLSSQIDPAITVTPSPAIPIVLRDIEISDSAAANDITAAMAEKGWTFVEADPPGAGAIGVLRTSPGSLAADASSIAPGDGWVDVITRTLTSRGGSSARIDACIVVSATIGSPRARITVEGAVVGPAYVELPLLDPACGTIVVPISLAAGSYTTYTIKLQVSSPTLLSTATPKKGCFLSVVEYASTQV